MRLLSRTQTDMSDCCVYIQTNGEEAPLKKRKIHQVEITGTSAGNDAYIDFAHSAVTDDPDSGDLRMYAKDDDLLYTRTSAGVETVIGSGTGGGGGVAPYGYMNGQIPDITYVTQNVYVPFIGLTEVLDGNGVTFLNDDTEGDKLVVPSDGAYSLSVTVGTTSVHTSGFDATFAVFVNNVESTLLQTHREFSGVTDSGSVAIIGMLDLLAGDELHLKTKVTTADAGAQITLIRAQFIVEAASGGAGHQPHGHMSQASGAAVTALTPLNTYVPFTDFSLVESGNGLVFLDDNTEGDKIVVPLDGVYSIRCTFSLRAQGTGAKDITFAVFINNVENTLLQTHREFPGTDTGSSAIIGLQQLSSGDQIHVKCKVASGTDDVTIDEIVVQVVVHGIDTTASTTTTARITESTGLFTGGILTVNANPILFDVTDGSGQIVDGDVVTPVSWTGLTGQSVAYVGNLTYLGINASGLVGFSTPWTPAQSRNHIFLGVLGHPDGINLIDVSTEPIYLGNPTNQFRDLTSALGVLNTSGNDIGPATLLTFQKSTGTIFSYGANLVNDVKNPSIVSIPALDTSGIDTFIKVFNDASLSVGNQSIDPDELDNGTGIGTPGSIGSNNWGSSRVFVSKDQLLVMPPQTAHGSLSEAEAHLFAETFVVPAGITAQATLVGYIIGRGGGTDLNDEKDAKFVQSGKFGGTSLVAGGGGIGTGFTTTLGTDNYVVGTDAGSGFLVGAEDNVVIGDGACDTSTIPTESVVIGKGSNKANNGIGNTILGVGCVTSATPHTSNYNVVVGNSTATTMAAGSSNTIVGADAGGTMTAGTNNTLVGRGCTAGVTGDSRISIGAFTDCKTDHHCMIGSENALWATEAITTGIDNYCDLGSSSRQFKDLYLGSNAILGGQGFSSTNTLSAIATIATDCDLGNVHSVTLSGAHTLGAPTNLKDGATYIWIITQSGAGGDTLAYNAVFKFPGGTAPVLSTGANEVDILTGVSDGTNVYCSLAKDFQ